MIVTLTANPAVDRAIRIDRAIGRGGVHTALSIEDHAGGKGVNVARAVAAGGVAATAVLPADAGDPVVRALRAAGVEVAAVPVGRASRVNIKVMEPDGETTTFNDPGPAVDDALLDALGALLRERAAGAAWVAMSGSLPPGAPVDWYAALVAPLRAAGARVAVDTSGAPLAATMAGPMLPDLLKPNAEELASLTGGDPAELEADPAAAVRAAAELVARGVGTVLATLGAGGAVLVDADGSWAATPPPIVLASTVGAGDASLAGYLMAAAAGLSAPDRLRRAVAYGAAAASLPGSAMPVPSDLDPDGVRVVTLSPTLLERSGSR